MRFQQSLVDQSLEVQKFQATNPEAHGLPRSYKISFKDVLPEKDASSIDGARIVFGQFGCETCGVTINDHVVESKDVAYCLATKSYHLDGTAQKLEADSHAINGHLDFNSAAPTGILSVNNSTYNVTLSPEPLKFNVKVSANAGAYLSTALRKLQFDPNSDAWKNATWEDTMEFSYDVKAESDPVLGQRTYIENYLTDKRKKHVKKKQYKLTKSLVSSPPTTFPLTFTGNGTIYTSVMDGAATSDGSLLVTTVSDISSIPNPPASRAGETVKSVFARTLAFKFSPFGDSFTGAYEDKSGRVYAVIGEMAPDPVSGMLSALSQPAVDIPVENIFGFDNDEFTVASDDEKPRMFAAAASASPLTINGLLNLSPMVVDSKDPTGFRDTVAQIAMQDFHDIIVYYMDNDLRSLFISATPIVLSPRVKAIADDDVGANRTFYKKLQVPYLSTFLAGSR